MHDRFAKQTANSAREGDIEVQGDTCILSNKSVSICIKRIIKSIDIYSRESAYNDEGACQAVKYIEYNYTQPTSTTESTDQQTTRPREPSITRTFVLVGPKRTSLALVDSLLCRHHNQRRIEEWPWMNR
jgi:hypothetical protein